MCLVRNHFLYSDFGVVLGLPHYLVVSFLSYCYRFTEFA